MPSIMVLRKQKHGTLHEQAHAWFLQHESRVVADVRTKSHLFAVSIDPKRPLIKLIGSEKAMPTAKMLLGAPCCCCCCCCADREDAPQGALDHTRILGTKESAVF